MKAAILGAGFIAEFHATGYAALEGVKLCAVCDSDPLKAQALAERFHCAWYTEASALLTEQKPDLVSVCLPTFLHADYVCMALENGAHVLCEKPLALTMEDCERMQRRAEACGRILMTGQVLRWWPEYQTIASHIHRLGAPLFIRAQRLQHPSRIGWQMQPDLGGGALFDLFVHDVDYILGLMGTDAEVVTANGSRGAEGSWRRVCATLRWPNGCHATVEACSQMPPHYPFTASFHAAYPKAALDYRFRTAVNIQLDAKAEAEFFLYDQGEATALPLSQNAQESAFRAEIAAFVQGVLEGVSPLPSEETLSVMRLIHQVKTQLEKEVSA